MEIRLKSTGQVMFESEFRAYLLANDGPTYDVLTPEVAEALEVDVVLEGPQASPTRYQIAFRDGVVEVDGKWYTKYSVSDMDDDAKTIVDETQAKFIRQERNNKLNDCDWTQLPDSKVDKDAWAIYRQKLRDITKQTNFPWDINWPEKP